MAWTLFDSDWYELTPAREWGDRPDPWIEPETLADEPEMLPSAGWRWHGPQRAMRGRAWGGNLEILHWLLAIGRVPSVAELAGCVLILETSQEMPDAQEVSRIVRNMGERGLLAAFPAIVVGRAMAWDFGRPLSVPERLAWATRSGRRSPAHLHHTTRTRWWSSTSTSVTPTRS
ncbi:hypothetical protein [Micromonospora sp. NPDC049662]|uniref:hypothetical protein n=1 Tax=Micromonospora sp. NPDC049662 TaxID=3155397 RepID=UPI0034384BFA